MTEKPLNAMPRFFITTSPIPYTDYVLPEAASHHAVRVLRLAAGDMVAVFDGSGCEWPAQIVRVEKHGVILQIGDAITPHRESALAVTLIQGISSGERMDFTLQKAVELGVQRIQPVACVRSVVRLTGERAQKRQQHWQQLVISACEQCGRNVVPEVLPIVAFNEGVHHADAGLRLLLDPVAKLTLRELPPPNAGVCLLAGPEGGFDPGEMAQAFQVGFVGVRLGPRVLRTETAALAAVSAMQMLWGDF
ncbi:MAG: 16S rRNA (uracil(1498)-N(3))-methyltransferase [Betaproteobacteria bacterium]|nr:16S rRNA (uracil(1498)-N(3))-methyltransferase [Betaproteobacteria bacterium]